jgi:hypothetical protein
MCPRLMSQKVRPNKGDKKIRKEKGASIMALWETKRVRSSKNFSGWRRILRSNVIPSVRILKARTQVYRKGYLRFDSGRIGGISSEKDRFLKSRKDSKLESLLLLPPKMSIGMAGIGLFTQLKF